MKDSLSYTTPSTPSLKPTVYCRYVDDILLVIDNINQLEQLKQTFETNSKLKFTFEIETCKQLPFLDTLITRKLHHLETTVYRKNTNTGDCINYNSICPDKYKTSVIKNFLNRAYAICTNWQLLNEEITRIKQLLVNNDFPNSLIDKITYEFLNKKYKTNQIINNTQEERKSTTDEIQPTNELNNTRNIPTTKEDQPSENIHCIRNDRTGSRAKLFYRNYMTTNYRQTEQQMKRIISDNIKGINDNRVELYIYYKNKKVRNLFIQNNNNRTIQQHNVVYEYLCDEELCNEVHTSYIGHTTTSLKERFKQHSTIKKHYREVHNRNITGSQMLPNVKILATCHNKQDLVIQEAIFIKNHKPIINTQCNDFNRTLKIFI